MSFRIRTAIGMFGPAAAAAPVRGPPGHEGFDDASLRLLAKRQPRGSWMYAAAYIVATALTAAGIGISLLVSYQHWTDPVLSIRAIVARQLAAAHRLRRRTVRCPLRSRFAQLAPITLALQLLAALTIGLAINIIFTLGEEFGWRYLLHASLR